MLLPFVSYTQSTHVRVDSLFWAMASNQEAYKGASEGFTNNENLNSLFTQYNVYKYEKAFPLCKNTKTKSCL